MGGGGNGGRRYKGNGKKCFKQRTSPKIKNSVGGSGDYFCVYVLHPIALLE
jgi:hypothetical protein